MEILNYKGFEITLDTSNGKFTGDGATRRNGKEFESTSLNSLKKKINDFVKENQSFGTFKVRNSAKGEFYNIKKLKDVTVVKGVTSNRRLTVEKPDGKTGTIGKYDINSLVLYNEEDNEIIDTAIAMLRKADKIYDEAKKRVKEVLNKIEEKPLVDFLKESNIDVEMRERGW